MRKKGKNGSVAAKMIRYLTFVPMVRKDVADLPTSGEKVWWGIVHDRRRWPRHPHHSQDGHKGNLAAPAPWKPDATTGSEVGRGSVKVEERVVYEWRFEEGRRHGVVLGLRRDRQRTGGGLWRHERDTTNSVQYEWVWLVIEGEVVWVA